ncbi:MAG: protein phosphatase CheZ [Gammaproteobacteria bacterium]|nr:protein phosphatase CheZ [Gammaproteobacteria bacterium]
MLEDKKFISNESIARARDLLATMERGDETGAKDVIDDLTHIRESVLYLEMGKLTRELHDSITAFGMDEQISKLAAMEIPNARQRLRHVIEMTDQAANRTLTAVEESLPICNGLESRSSTLQGDWQRFKQRKLDLNEFRALATRLDEFFQENTSDATRLRESLNNVLMAQDFQDLTSQIIKKVITLVEEVESNLVGLIKLTSGKAPDPASIKADTKDDKELAGPVVPGVNQKGTVSGQDEVDALLSSLGF